MNAPASAPGDAKADHRSMAGRQLGRYEILTQLASGGMASVYIARAQGVAGFERLVAIKVLHPHLAYEQEFISMFLDEARLAARIRHMNVVPTLDISDSQGDGYFLVMEYIEGDHLGALLGRAAKQGERLPRPFVCRVIVDALQGLSAAHRLNDEKGNPLKLVHRDVSPHNILIGTDGIARLTDFGVAKAEVRMASTRAGQFKGKLSYMAPEQASTGTTDQRSDLFSMGIILWESFTGRRLFKGESNAATLNKLLHDPVPKPSELWPDLAEFDEVTVKALQRDPDERFQTAEEFVEALEQAAGRAGLASTRRVAAVVRQLASEKIESESARVRDAIDHLGRSHIGKGHLPMPKDGLSQPSQTYSRSLPEGSISGVLPDGTPIFIRTGNDPRLLRWFVMGLGVLVLLYAGFLGWQFTKRPSVEPPPVAAPAPRTAEPEAAEASPPPRKAESTRSGEKEESAARTGKGEAEAPPPVERPKVAPAPQQAKAKPRRPRRRARPTKPKAPRRADTTSAPVKEEPAPPVAPPTPPPNAPPEPKPVDIEISNPYRN